MDIQKPPEAVLPRLEGQTIIWFGSVRSDLRPHLAPVWFLWLDGAIYISTDPKSIKIKNIANNPNVILALEDGTHPVILEGLATIIKPPYDDAILKGFFKKYEWDINTDKQYHQIVEVRARKWLAW